MEGSEKPERETEDLKESQTVENNENENVENLKKSGRITNIGSSGVRPLGEYNSEINQNQYQTGTSTLYNNQNNSQYAYRMSY
jgi:hypothetical protein